MENNNKKTLILSIVGILVLVIAVVGVSFAMFTFSGTGTKENVIKTGTITIDFNNATKQNKIEIDNKYPMDDTTGMAQEDNIESWTVQANWGSSPMIVNYEVGLSDLTTTPAVADGGTLTESYVKVAITKNGSYVKGDENGGVLISSFANDHGSLNLIQDHYVTNGTLQNGHLSDTFTVQTYVADTYDLPDDAANSTSPEVNGGTVNNQSGAYHKKTSKANTFSFKIHVVAAQQ